MPDTAIRLTAVAAALSDAELSEILTSVGERGDVTPEQRAAIDEAALRLKARPTGEGDRNRIPDPC